MKLSFRWYGESDPVTLGYIRQIPNMRSIVSAVYDVKPGEVWPEESIKKMKDKLPVRFAIADGECHLDGCIFTIDTRNGKCLSIERISIS